MARRGRRVSLRPSTYVRATATRTPALDRLLTHLAAHPGCRQAEAPVSGATVLRALRAGKVMRTGKRGAYRLHLPVTAPQTRHIRLGAYRPTRSEYVAGGNVDALQALLAGGRGTWTAPSVRS